MRKILFNLLLLVSLGDFTLAQNDLQTLYVQATEAYKKGDYESFLKGMQQVDRLRPNHPTILYNLSIAYAKNDFTDQALRTLERVLWMNTNYPFDSDTSFNSINTLPGFENLVSLKKELITPYRTSTLFKEIDKEHIIHAEGIAYDEKSGTFFLGDVRSPKIIRVSADGRVTAFGEATRLQSVMGMDIDNKRGLLWVCSSPMDEMLQEKEDKLSAGVLAFEVESGRLIHSGYAESSEALFGDLIVAENGDVYTTSSAASHAAIYKFDIKSQQFKLFHLFEDLISLQGLTFDKAQENLFFSDYREGLFKLNLASGARTKLMNYTRQSLKGVDGLYMHNNRLIAVHNGLRPFQLTAYQLNVDQTAITSFEQLDRALPEMGEPTLGALTGGSLYYIANSPWPYYDTERNLDVEKLKSTIIMKLDLE